MSRGRQLPDRDYQALFAATRQLVTAAGGPVAAAAITRGDHQSISRYGSAHPDNADRFMPIDVLADLESECEQPVLTKELARLSGHLLVPVPRVVRSGTALGAVTASALKETSEVFVALADGLGDGRLCAADAAHIGREIDEALAKLAALKLQVNAEAESEV
ncbi:phage regulatory CII family protein [Devosia ginsengisoli]|uniref:phage regulatory CII family protein n=1 Tax=Devosia ginsengisoli TaxID=400770 RepID=UPI0026ED8537|nr:phage regulatory CII family protein [Devosia ginsengisoli]